MMNNTQLSTVRSIKKLHIESAAMFAIENIPETDEDTLQKFVDLINVTGNFGAICESELLEKIRLFRTHIPKACGYSLYLLTELLDIAPVPAAPDTRPVMITTNNEPTIMTHVNKRGNNVSVRR